MSPTENMDEFVHQVSLIWPDEDAEQEALCLLKAFGDYAPQVVARCGVAARVFHDMPPAGLVEYVTSVCRAAGLEVNNPSVPTIIRLALVARLPVVR